MIETILLCFVCTQLVNVIEGRAMEQVLKWIKEWEINDIATFNLFGKWLWALHLWFQSGHKPRATLCHCDVYPFLVEPTEKSLEVDNFRMNTVMVDTVPLIIWLLYFALMMNFHVFE
jgi:hypothetical protein